MGKGALRRIDAWRAADRRKIIGQHVVGPTLLAIDHAGLRRIGIAANGRADVILGESIAARAHDQALLQTVHVAPQKGVVFALAAHQSGELQAPEQHRAVLAVELAADETVVKRRQETVAGEQPDQGQASVVPGGFERSLHRVGQGAGKGHEAHRVAPTALKA